MPRPLVYVAGVLTGIAIYATVGLIQAWNDIRTGGPGW